MFLCDGRKKRCDYHHLSIYGYPCLEVLNYYKDVFLAVFGS